MFSARQSFPEIAATRRQHLAPGAEQGHFALPTRGRAFVLAALALLLAGIFRLAPARAGEINFDEVPAGTVVNEHYAYMGVHISATGTGLDSIIAAPPCETVISAPNVLSYQPLGECPAARDETGWFVVDFDQPQNRVSITVVHRGPDTTAYFKAFSSDGFFDIAWSEPGSDTVGVPQILVLQPPTDRPRIIQVQFGIYRLGNSAYFDDLDLDVVVANASHSWSSLKAAWQ